jgi:hypothetical protein
MACLVVARRERSEIRGDLSYRPPHFASLNAGYNSRFPGAAQHVAKRSGATQTRDRYGTCLGGPASAEQRFTLHRARETQSVMVRCARSAP